MSDKLIPLKSGTQDYIFTIDSDNPVFVGIEVEMAQLNEYCVLCLTETFNKLADLNIEFEEYQSQKGIEKNADRLNNLDDWIMELSEIEIPFWESNFGFVAPAMCLILLSFFLEKSLKSICFAYAPNGINPPIQKKRGNKVSMYLKFLQADCHFKLDAPVKTMDTWNKCNKIRNAFAHGDWDEVKSEIARTDLRETFSAISELIRKIESGQPYSLPKSTKAQ